MQSENTSGLCLWIFGPQRSWQVHDDENDPGPGTAYGRRDPDLWRRLDFIRRVGNNAAHNGKKITLDQAKLCLENLYIFLDFVAYCYAKDYTEGEFHAEQRER